MTDDDTVERLRAAMAVETRDHHLPADAARRARAVADERRARPPLALAAALVATVLVIAGVAWWLRPVGDGSPATQPATCRVDRSPLPPWARAGFSADGITAPHVSGSGGGIVAILFVTLRVDQPPGTHNKVLWVPRDGSIGTLAVRATLGERTVTRTLPLGPSYLDLPAAGCWQLDLRWSGHHDRLNLRYAP